jgi:hypothetical protein
MAPASSITSPQAITALLKQSPEWAYMWAESLFDVISKYNPGQANDEEGNSDEDVPESKGRKS